MELTYVFYRLQQRLGFRVPGEEYAGWTCETKTSPEAASARGQTTRRPRRPGRVQFWLLLRLTIRGCIYAVLCLDLALSCRKKVCSYSNVALGSQTICPATCLSACGYFVHSILLVSVLALVGASFRKLTPGIYLSAIATASCLYA